MQKKIRLKITGTQPLLMSNGQLVDPLNEWTKLIAIADKDTKKRKTEEAVRSADRLRWLGQVYHEDGNPILPIDNLLACLLKAARMHRLGKKVEAGVYVESGSLLEFNGPGQGKTVEELADMPEYAHRKRTKRGVIAHRPCFNKWASEYEVMYDTSIIDDDEFELVLNTAGSVGIGAWPARFGKFKAEVLS